MKKFEVVITSISYGRDLVARTYPKPSNSSEIANDVYISGCEKGTFNRLGFKTTLDSFAKLINKHTLSEGAVLSLEARELEKVVPPKGSNHHSYGGGLELLNIEPTNYHDLNAQIIDFPEILFGSDPITETYGLSVKLIGGVDAGKEIEIRVSKDSFYGFVMPVRQCTSFNRLDSLGKEDMKVFFEKGDALTFKSCMIVEDDIYESMGWVQPMSFDAEVTMLATKMFHKDPRFDEGHCKLSVMFNNSHLIGRVCDVQFSISEKPNFTSSSKLQITGARKMGVGDPPCVVVRSIALL